MDTIDSALLANYQSFLYTLQGTLQRLFPRDFVYLAELSGAIVDKTTGQVDYDQNYQRYTRAMDGNREHFDGSDVRFPLMLSGLQAGGTVSENGTWNEPIAIQNSKATVTLGQVLQPFAISLALDRDSKSGSRSAMSALEMYTTEAYSSVARIENDMLHGNGDALLAAITNGDADGLVATVGTGANFDVLTPGRVVDVLVSANGNDPGQGKRRLIKSVDRSAGTVTFDTAQQASDGGSGNITLSTAGKGIYITGSYGSALQGTGQATAQTGTFEGVDRSSVPKWKSVSIDAGAAGLSAAVLDNATYLARGQGAGWHHFGIAHPKVVDEYKQSLTPTVYYQPQEVTLRSGFSGIVYQGADKPYPIVKDLAAPRKKCRLIRTDFIQLYGDSAGPSFIDDDGGMARFFNRQTVKEYDLLDRVQVAFTDVSKLVEITNLAEAS